jgi:hypothetical protein
MVPFASEDRGGALAWAQQQHATSQRGGGTGVVMHVMRDAVGGLWVIAEHERKRFAQLGGEPHLVESVPGVTAP